VLSPASHAARAALGLGLGGPGGRIASPMAQRVARAAAASPATPSHPPAPSRFRFGGDAGGGDGDGEAEEAGEVAGGAASAPTAAPSAPLPPSASALAEELRAAAGGTAALFADRWTALPPHERDFLLRRVTAAALPPTPAAAAGYAVPPPSRSHSVSDGDDGGAAAVEAERAAQARRAEGVARSRDASGVDVGAHFSRALLFGTLRAVAKARRATRGGGSGRRVAGR
jgi:hypothetical protein